MRQSDRWGGSPLNSTGPQQVSQVGGSRNPMFLDVDHLSNMMVDVRRALHDGIETVHTVRHAGSLISLTPLLRSLRFNGPYRNFNSSVKPSECFGFRGWIWIGEFQIAVSNVASMEKLLAKIEIQVPSQMQNEVPKTISIRERSRPKLLFVKRGRPLVYATGVIP